MKIYPIPRGKKVGVIIIAQKNKGTSLNNRNACQQGNYKNQMQILYVILIFGK